MVADLKVDVLLLHHLAIDTLQLPTSLLHVTGSLLEHHLAAVDACHLQHVVDEREEEAARLLNLHQVVTAFVRIPQTLLHEMRETDDGIHGRADVVRHTEEEVALGLVG